MAQDAARELRRQYPAITGCRIALAPGEARIEVLLPQHQVIVNAASDDAKRALAAALGKIRSQLDAILARDRAPSGLPKAA